MSEFMEEMLMLHTVVSILNGLINAIANVLNAILMLLPNSPFHFDEVLAKEYMGYISFFVPVKQMLVIGSAWLLAILTYYAIHTILRWIKVLE